MLTAHILGVLFSLAVVAVADSHALAWVLGKTPHMNARRLRVLHLLTWAGLATLLVSGVFLTAPAFSYLVRQPLFIMKMLFVAVLFVNAILIGRLSHVAIEKTFAELTARERARLLTSGAVSFFSWTAAVILALVVFK